jgi:voltage-gated potassium channel
MRMASEALRPHVVNFLDLMLKERAHTMRVEEIDVPEGGAWVGLSMIDVDLRGRYHLLPLAVKAPVEQDKHHHEMEFIFDPPDTHQLTAHSVLVVMGAVQEVKRAKQDAHHKRISTLTTSGTR